MADPARMSWLWSIEYLSKFEQLDPSILHDLIDEAPELSDDLGNNTREMVALRCLEQLLGTSKEVGKDVRSVTQPKGALDFSNSCEDVLRSVVNERPVSDLKRFGGDLLTWDIQPFILHKRASMPKCTLEKLKERILEGTHPYTASLTELSGLVQKNGLNDRITVDYGCHNAPDRGVEINGSDSQIMAPETKNVSLPETSNVSLSLENRNGMVEGDSIHAKFLPGKRKVSVEDNEHPAEDYQEVQEGDLSLNVKRFKCDMSCANNKSKEHVLIQLGNGLVEDSSEMMVRLEGKGICHVDGESPAGGSSECMSSKNAHYKFVATEIIGRIPNANANGESGEYQCENDNRCNNLLPDTSGYRPCQNSMVDEVNTAEPSASNDAPFMRTRQKVLVGGTKDNSDSGNQVTSANAASPSESSRRIAAGKAGSSPKHLYEEETSIDGNKSHHERVDVELEKRHFFSSHCTLNHVSQENWTELNLCVKCSKGGQLLVCNAVGCPLVVHEKCLGSSPSFDEKGEFYCPFCAYSRAISEYLKAKKKASLARKELGSFISTRTKRSHAKEHDNLERNQDGACFHMVHECGNLEEKESDQTNNIGHVNQGNEQLKERQGGRLQMEPVISNSEINLISREKEPDLTLEEKEKKGMAPECPHIRETYEHHHICVDPKGNVDQITKNKEDASENEEQATQRTSEEVLGQQSSEKEQDVTHGEKERKWMASECLHAREPDKQDQICADPKSDSGDKISKIKEPVSVNEEQAKQGTREDVLVEQSSDLIEKPTSAIIIERQTSGEGNEDNVISNYTMRSRGRQVQYVSHYPALHSWRRKKNPWTTEEEQMLKEGVQKFSSVGDRTMPWAKILEYGSMVFCGRTAVDLKDKWRNMCKASSKPR